MASKKSTSKKHYPVVRQMPLGEPSFANRSKRLGDTGRILSQANRRLYRYARYYNIKLDLEPDAGTSFEVYALRDDWAVQKAVQMAYKAYMHNTAGERASMSKSQIARWEDFRIDSGEASSSTSDIGPIFSRNGILDDALAIQGEFALSEVVDEDENQKTFSWIGSSTQTAYSVLAEYDKAGNAQQAPSSAVSLSVGPYQDLDDEMDGDTFQNLEANGDNPPYDRDGVNAMSPWIKIATLDSSNPNAQKLSTGFFTAPCGLFLIVQAGASDIVGKYSLTVKAGDYKGVHAPSMLE